VYLIIPDALGLSMRSYRPGRDFTHTGHVARVIGRVWK